MTALDSARLPLDSLRAQTGSRSESSMLALAKGVSASKIDKSSELYKACQDFQSILIKQMLDAMRKTVDKSGLTEKNMGEDIFEDMLYDERAKSMSQSAGFGLADTMYQQLTFLQNLPKAPSAAAH